MDHLTCIDPSLDPRGPHQASLDVSPVGVLASSHRARLIINLRDHQVNQPSIDPCVRAAVTILRCKGKHQGRTRISFTYLEYLAGIKPRQLWRYLKLRPVRDAMTKFGWSHTNSRTLKLPALDNDCVPFLIRQ